MTGRRIAILGLAWVAIALAAAPAFCQTYTPARPTISPWFNLYRRDGGPIDNYNMFVRPQNELNQTLNQQQQTTLMNRAAITQLNRDFVGLQRERTAEARPTGTHAGFMNFSHFYSARTGAPARTAVRSSAPRASLPAGSIR